MSKLHKKQLPWFKDVFKMLSMARDIANVNTNLCRRTAFILLDQALEIAVRSYLQYHKKLIPKVVSRKDWEKQHRNFTFLFDLMQKHCTEIDEEQLQFWTYHHQTRNLLYHQPHPVSVSENNIADYLKFAYSFVSILFKKKLKKDKEPFWKDHRRLAWKIITIPENLPSYTRGTIPSYPLQFEVRNISDFSLRTRIYVNSRSQALIFKLTEPVKTGFIFKKEVDYSIDMSIDQMIGEQQKTTFTFQMIFRPKYLRPRDAYITLEYWIYAFTEDGSEVLKSGPHQTLIPIKQITAEELMKSMIRPLKKKT